MTEAELSADAQAILTYARHWGEPFARLEITDVAPGAAWNPKSPWPRTVAKVNPIRELVRAGLIEVAEERRSKGGHGGNRYKVYRLTEHVKSLADLLDAYGAEREWIGAYTPDVGTLQRDKAQSAVERADALRAEILERFGDPR